jgi:TonB-linked SusC/RagA family outer membrane protein
MKKKQIRRKVRSRLHPICTLLVCLFLSGLGTWASAAQSGIDVRLKNASGEEVFRSIRQASGYTFVYDSDAISELQPLTADVKDATIDQIMASYLKDTGFTYEIEDNVVIIRSRGINQRQQQSQQPQPKTIAVKGTVRDSKKDLIAGVIVRLKDAEIGVSTDSNGQYTINIPADVEKPVLIFSLVGMKTTEIACAGKPEINTVLEEDIQTLGNVVITGIFNKSKESYTGAERTITKTEMDQFKGRNIFQTLTNIDPSFNVIQNNTFGSDPNHLPEIQIRGPKNLPNINQLQDETSTSLNTPLIVMDGFITDLQKMMDLNNEEIESVTILKDATATALYGARGANGIIVIKTKDPGPGKLRLYYRSNLEIQLPDLSSYHVLNSRDKLELERLSGYYENNTKDAGGNLNLQQYYNEVLAQVEKGVNTDWLAKPLRTGIGQTHNLSLEGGEKSFRYRLAARYNDTKGVMKGSDRENFNGAINLSYKHDKIIFYNNLSIDYTQSEESPYGSFADYVELNPYWKPYDSEGKLVRYFTPYSRDYWTQTGKVGFDGQYRNPMYDAALNTYNRKNYTNITDNFSAEWRPFRDLFVRAAIGISANMNYGDIFYPAEHSRFLNYAGNDIFRKGEYYYSNGKSFSWTPTLSVNYSRLFAEKHLIYTGLSTEISESKYRNYSFVAEGFPDESIDFLARAQQYQSAGKPNGSEATSRNARASYNLNYSFDNRYLLDATLTYEGSSKFGFRTRFAPFYALGIGWNVHQESFIRQAIPAINHLKLRASYGTTGSNNSDSYLPLVTYSYITDDRYNMWFGAQRNGLGNPNLEWQKTTQTNAGFEANLFNNHLSLKGDIYLNKISNLLSDLELPYSNGFPSYTENIGNVETRGYELGATVFLIRNTPRRLYWSVTGLLNYDENKIVRLSEAMKAANKKLLESYGSYPNRIFTEGTSQYTIYVVPSLGIDPSTGKELFLNKDGEVTYQWSALDRVPAGISQPKYNGRFSSLVRFQNISFNVFFSFRTGGQLYNQTLIDRVENAIKLMNVDERVFTDRWKQPGDKTFFRGINETAPVNASSRFVQDESTLECEGIYLSYEISNKKWLSRIGLQSLTWSVNTGNLFRISTIKQERGIDYPYSRQISTAINLMF